MALNDRIQGNDWVEWLVGKTAWCGQTRVESCDDLIDSLRNRADLLVNVLKDFLVGGDNV